MFHFMMSEDEWVTLCEQVADERLAEDPEEPCECFEPDGSRSDTICYSCACEASLRVTAGFAPGLGS